VSFVEPIQPDWGPIPSVPYEDDEDEE